MMTVYENFFFRNQTVTGTIYTPSFRIYNGKISNYFNSSDPNCFFRYGCILFAETNEGFTLSVQASLDEQNWTTVRTLNNSDFNSVLPTSNIGTNNFYLDRNDVVVPYTRLFGPAYNFRMSFSFDAGSGHLGLLGMRSIFKE